ncbi:MAG: hypothetical protein QM703_21665 [Gemmatales bacterium]
MLPRVYCMVMLLFVGLHHVAVADDQVVQSKPVDTLRLVPQNAVAVFHCGQPKHAVDQLLSYITKLELAKFDEVQEFLQSTPYQHFDRYLKYLEKEYGRPWGKLLDDLTGQGLTVALIRPEEEKKEAHVLGVMAARDANLLKRVYAVALEYVKQEAQSMKHLRLSQQRTIGPSASLPWANSFSSPSMAQRFYLRPKTR